MGVAGAVWAVFNPYDDWVGLEPDGWGSEDNYGIISVAVIWLGTQITVGAACLWFGIRLAKRSLTRRAAHR
jgi:hypothetical protein